MFNFLRRRKPPEEQEQEQQKVEDSLQKTRKGFFGQIADLFAADDITTEMWDDLLDLLVMADLGPDTVNLVLDEVERRVERDSIFVCCSPSAAAVGAAADSRREAGGASRRRAQRHGAGAPQPRRPAPAADDGPLLRPARRLLHPVVRGLCG